MSLNPALETAVPARPHRLVCRLRRLCGGLTRGAALLAPIAARSALAIPFLRSGLTKWSGWFSVSPVADALFESIFKLHLFGHQYGFPMPVVLAHLDAVAEVALPMLLIAGLATRFSALGLLIMTGVIQLTVPSGWANFHLPWAALALTLVTLGGGPLSADYLIARCLAKRRQPSRARLNAQRSV